MLSRVETPTKSSPEAIARATAWNLANPERARANRLKSYLKHRPPLKPILTPMQRFDKHWIPVTESGCWIWTAGCNEQGYGKVKVNKKHIQSHRWAWMLFRGDIPSELCVCHRCDVTSCVNPDHLFLGTNQDNVDDRERKGRGPVMAIHRETNLTDEDVLKIRQLRGVMRQVDIGERYGLHHSQISRIQRGLSFGHLDTQEG